MNQTPGVSTRNINTDIVCIGGGGTGLAAAVAAGEKGARAVVLEKGNAPGGNSARAVGFFAAESPAQKRFRIDAPKDVLFKMAMDYAHWRINARILRAFIEKSGDTVRWLEDKGLVIDRIPVFMPNQVMRTEHDAVNGGSDVIKVLLKSCEELGIPVLRRTAARKIVLSTDGVVSGVQAEDENGKFQINARCVIIGSGGYAANKELIKKYSNWYTDEIQYRGLPLTGDGLLMAMEIGAATEGLGQLRMIGPIFEGAHRNLGEVCNQPQTIWVNAKGERYVDEMMAFNHFESVNALLQQPGRVSYTLFDEAIKENIFKEGPVKVKQANFYGREGLNPASFAEQMREEEAKGTVKIAGSWEPIARWIGVEPDILKTNIEDYNRCCEHGHDDILAKDRRYMVPLCTPPYYGMKARVSITTTQGGLKINHRMEVLDEQDNPISGLYAGGDATGGWEPETYNVNLSGSGLGFALNSGRIAAENAVRYITHITHGHWQTEKS